MEVIYNFNIKDAKINISTGNTKIGKMMNWSTLPGNVDNKLIAKGRLLTEITGTCSHNCTGCFKNCYARRSILQHHNSVCAPWAYNTLMMRDDLDHCFELIDAEIHRLNKEYYETEDYSQLNFEFFRINVSGELTSLEELEHWNDLARIHPEIRFGLYTKNAEVVIPFFMKHKQTEKNLCINISEWHGIMKDTIDKLHAMGAIFNVFEYDDSNMASSELTDEEKARLSKMVHCPAVGATADNKHPINPKTGETWHCHECKGCYTKTGTHRCVYAH